MSGHGSSVRRFCARFVEFTATARIHACPGPGCSWLTEEIGDTAGLTAVSQLVATITTAAAATAAAGTAAAAAAAVVVVAAAAANLPSQEPRGVDRRKGRGKGIFTDNESEHGYPYDSIMHWIHSVATNQ